jgi:DNA-binding transcriptional MerR regulator
MAAGLTLGQLAELVGMSPRNVRAHQSRGLLQPPTVYGRVAYYDAHHVARLRLIQSLQEQGFNLAGIQRVIELTSLYQPVTTAVAPELLDSQAPLGALLDIIEQARPGAAAELERLGIVHRVGDDLVAPVPVVGLAARLVEEGMPVDLVLDLGLDACRVAYDVGRRYAAASGSGQGAETPREDLELVVRNLLRLTVELAFAHGVEAAPAAGPRETSREA